MNATQTMTEKIKKELGIPAQEGLYIRIKALKKRGQVFLHYAHCNSFGNLYAFRDNDPSRKVRVSPEVWEYIKGYETINHLGYTYLDYPFGARKEEIYF